MRKRAWRNDTEMIIMKILKLSTAQFLLLLRVTTNSSDNEVGREIQYTYVYIYREELKIFAEVK